MRRNWQWINRHAGGLTGDLALYLISAAFTGVIAVTTSLASHRAWATVAVIGYTIATATVLVQLAIHRYAGTPPPERGNAPTDPARSAPSRGQAGAAWTGVAARSWLTGLTWVAVAAVPLVLQAVQRAGGRADRAQEEVLVVEDGGARLLAGGSPYLSQQQIVTLPAEDQLLGYLPYQPGMALFGVPRALAGVSWWTDARVWFAVATVAALGAAIVLSYRRATTGGGEGTLVRAAQLSSVLPIYALTLSTGGGDLPVLALALLALVLCATGRYGAAGAAIGAAAALKLFAWPILVVLLCHAATRGRHTLGRLAIGGIGLPLLALLPAVLVDGVALVHNVLAFPLGNGVVGTPAQSPLPGQLVADWLPGGRFIAGALLLTAGLVIAARLLRRPPRTAAAAALICWVGLLAATMLLPSTRFGYLLYPIALLSWVPTLRAVQRPAPADLTRSRTGTGR
ncbi:glycosyltransferase 87 family protein [Micromonospora sp. NBC_01813]|nr:glycosyltransferase 87 family protein [Micromonospora sp. NBC_01813]WSA12796.1 glycosyltransferase 87 family protein [Micromonospora sp. NBC_01813]